MKQERYKRSLKWIEFLIEIAEKEQNVAARANGKQLYVFTRYCGALKVFRPVRHALNKAIEKPAREAGNGAYCPDCGNRIKRKDNFCSVCGQRLSRERKEPPFYAKYEKERRNGR